MPKTEPPAEAHGCLDPKVVVRIETDNMCSKHSEELRDLLSSVCSAVILAYIHDASQRGELLAQKQETVH